MAEIPAEMLQEISLRLRDTEKFNTVRQQADIHSQNETTKAVVGLTDTFKQFFKAERRDKESDKLEASREAQGQVTKTEAVSQATSSDTGIDELDFGGSYVAMIGGALTGLATGLTAALVTQIGGVTRAIGRFFRIDVLLKAVGTKVATFSKTIANFFKPITNFFVNITRQFKAGFAGLKTARSATGQFMKLGIFGRIGSFFASLVKPFTLLSSTLRGALGGLKSVGVIGKFFGTLKSFFGTFIKIGSRFLVPLQILIGLFSGITGAFKGFTEFEGNFVEKLIAGGFGAIKGIINSLIMMPLDLLKDGISWIAGKLGFEGFAEILDGFSFTGLFTKLLDGITGLITSIFSDFDTENILSSIMKVAKRIVLFPVALLAGAGAALFGLFKGDPVGAFKETFNKVLTAGEGANTSPGTGGRTARADSKENVPEQKFAQGTTGGRRNKNNLEKPDQMERADAIAAAESRKESRETVIIDNSTNSTSSSQGDSLVMSGGPEPAINTRKQSRG